MKSALALILAVFLVSSTAAAQSVKYRPVPGEDIQNVDKYQRHDHATVTKTVPVKETGNDLPEGETLQDETQIGHLGRPVIRDGNGRVARLKMKFLRLLFRIG